MASQGRQCTMVDSLRDFFRVLNFIPPTLATKMRLTNQSRYPTRTAARREQATRTKPWDLGQDGSQLDRSS
jgi:hypothetical protein